MLHVKMKANFSHTALNKHRVNYLRFKLTENKYSFFDNPSLKVENV